MRVHAQVHIVAPHKVHVLVVGLLVRMHHHPGRQRGRQLAHVFGVGQLVAAACAPAARVGTAARTRSARRGRREPSVIMLMHL